MVQSPHFMSGGRQITANTLPLLPALSNLQHWWDTTDVTKVFEDTAQTTPATNGNPLRSVVDKGTALEDMTEAAANVPNYLTNNVNGFGTLRGIGALQGLNSGILATPSSAVGEAFLMIARRSGATGTENAVGLGNAQVSAVQFVSAPDTGIRVKVPGFPTFVNTNHLMVDNEWTWTYGTVDAAGDWRIRTSGETEVTGNTAYVQRDGTNFGNMGGPIGTVDVAEFLVWDKDLSVAEINAAILYVNVKYGVMPFVGT